MKKIINFSQQIKKEITSLEFKTCCKKSLLSSFFANCISIILNSHGQSWEIKSQYRFIITFINDVLSNIYKIEKKMSYTEKQKINNQRMYILNIKGDLDLINKDLKLFEQYNLIIKNECCSRAYVAAAFLSGGSINSLDKKNYHLEIRSRHSEYLRTIQKILEKYKIMGVIHKRAKNYIFYIKRAEEISDFLKFISTYNSFHEFEDIRIQRDFNVQVVRLNNIDVSNLKKTIQAANDQVEKINSIIKTNSFNDQSSKFKIFCYARLKYQQASLLELTKILEDEHKLKITKAGLNHFVRKLKKL